MFNRQKIFWKSRKKYLHFKEKGYNILANLFLIKCRLINRKSNSGIPINKNVNEFYAPHGLSGIYISKKAVIGKSCTIFHQVTIGSNDLKDSKYYGSPKIGNNVYIGAGAKIIGNINVGNNVRIGANCVVFKDVPDNVTIVLGEPRILKRKEK